MTRATNSYTTTKAERRLIEAALRVHRLEGEIDGEWLRALHPTDRSFYKACIAVKRERSSATPNPDE